MLSMRSTQCLAIKEAKAKAETDQTCISILSKDKFDFISESYGVLTDRQIIKEVTER